MKSIRTRFAIGTAAVLFLALVACGGQDTAQTSAGSDVAGDESMPAEEMGALPAVSTPPPSAAPDPKVASCLGSVREGKFAEAIPICTEAIGADPDNAEVRAALDKAKSQVASADAARQAAEGAASGAAGDAAKQLGETAPGMPKLD